MFLIGQGGITIFLVFMLCIFLNDSDSRRSTIHEPPRYRRIIIWISRPLNWGCYFSSFTILCQHQLPPWLLPFRRTFCVSRRFFYQLQLLSFGSLMVELSVQRYYFLSAAHLLGIFLVFKQRFWLYSAKYFEIKHLKVREVDNTTLVESKYLFRCAVYNFFTNSNDAS